MFAQKTIHSRTDYSSQRKTISDLQTTQEAQNFERNFMLHLILENIIVKIKQKKIFKNLSTENEDRGKYRSKNKIQSTQS